VIGEVRGEGLLIGLKCKPAGGMLVEALMGERMLSVGAGDNVVRLLPPLTVSEAEIIEACDKINSACAVVSGRLHGKDTA
jgi:acetylornithine/N-succinyldiaminopimelate aminotransferase